jgi:hypothetical protein
MADRDVVFAGLDWLYRTEQPGNAILQHHGVQHASGPVAFGFCPLGAEGAPVVSAWPVRPLTGPDDFPSLTADETAAVRDLITSLGGRIRQEWRGGFQHREASCFGMADPAIVSLRQSVSRYRAGCPEHGSVFCKCSWYSTGHALVVMPYWDRPAPTSAAPDGCQHIAVDAGPEYRPDTSRLCRGMIAQRTYCRKPSILVIMREYGNRGERRTYGYCSEHSYGRWVENGKVMKWILREKTDG